VEKYRNPHAWVTEG